LQKARSCEQGCGVALEVAVTNWQHFLPSEVSLFLIKLDNVSLQQQIDDYQFFLKMIYQHGAKIHNGCAQKLSIKKKYTSQSH